MEEVDPVAKLLKNLIRRSFYLVGQKDGLIGKSLRYANVHYLLGWCDGWREAVPRAKK